MKNDLINQMRQNRPSLVVDDLLGIGWAEDEIYATLLDRGIFKWLSVRRKLIRLKLDWKAEITETLDEIRTVKEGLSLLRMNREEMEKRQWIHIRPGVDRKEIQIINRGEREYRNRLAELRGYLKALNKCRQEVRSLCDSPRLQCPDNDRRAREWFRGMRRNGK